VWTQAAEMLNLTPGAPSPALDKAAAYGF